MCIADNSTQPTSKLLFTTLVISSKTVVATKKCRFVDSLISPNHHCHNTFKVPNLHDCSLCIFELLCLQLNEAPAFFPSCTSATSSFLRMDRVDPLYHHSIFSVTRGRQLGLLRMILCTPLPLKSASRVGTSSDVQDDCPELGLHFNSSFCRLAQSDGLEKLVI